MVEVLVDFASSAIFGEQTAKNSETAHPQDLAMKLRKLTCQKHNPNTFEQRSCLHVRKSHPASKIYLTLTANLSIANSKSPIPPTPKIPRREECDKPWHSGVLGTLSLTETAMSSDFSSLCELPGSGT